MSGSPLAQALGARLRLLETTLQSGTLYGYRRTARWFLDFLQRRFPAVTCPSQLQRDPHVLGWLEDLWTYRTRRGQPLHQNTRAELVLRLRTLLELLSDLAQPPPHDLLRSSDIPKRKWTLPRPLTAEDDARLRGYWDTATGTLDTALFLMRLTGLRIGECVDLTPDCLRHLGDNQWSLHVPHGKPRSERWVPVDDRVRQLVERLAFLRTLPPVANSRFLLARPHGRNRLLLALRQQLRLAAQRAGLTPQIVPHQLRHTYATTLLRAGISLPALMRLLGHHNANMTLIYVEITQQDLQRQYLAALQQPRYLVPSPPTQPIPSSSKTLDACLTTVIRILAALSANPPMDVAAQPLRLLHRRLVRINSALKKLLPDAAEEK